MIFACAGVDFIDNRIKMDDWPALKNRDTFELFNKLKYLRFFKY